ncbi:MAG: inositol monophosphatase [Spirochaetes bacterium]|nr:inositol monophosphatase [Spirochaetota bacterium]
MEKFIKKTILETGKILLNNYHKTHRIEYKNPRDLVTEIDKKAEKYIKGEIHKKFPDHQIIAEESRITNIKNKEDVWYIDPIDGTTNFIHKYPLFGICIAYEHKGELNSSAVYFPILKELYQAEKNKGAYKNRKRISVSGQTELIHTLAATGFADIRAGKKDNNLKYINAILPRIHDIRRSGSAAYDLCSVAGGSIDIFWEMELNSWDIMAGKLILEEAGGKLTDFSGKKKFLQNRRLLASNGTSLHKRFLNFFR